MALPPFTSESYNLRGCRPCYLEAVNGVTPLQHKTQEDLTKLWSQRSVRMVENISGSEDHGPAKA